MRVAMSELQQREKSAIRVYIRKPIVQQVQNRYIQKEGRKAVYPSFQYDNRTKPADLSYPL